MDENEKQDEWAEDAGLILNLDVLQTQNKTTSALGDLYGYPVFSSGFKTSIDHVKEKEKNELEQNFINVMRNEPRMELDQAFEAVIAGEPQIVIKYEYQTDAGQNNLWFSTLCILAGMLLTAGIWLSIDKIRRDQTIRENNSDNYGTDYDELI